jgi:hypothetical protein
MINVLISLGVLTYLLIGFIISNVVFGNEHPVISRITIVTWPLTMYVLVLLSIVITTGTYLIDAMKGLRKLFG